MQIDTVIIFFLGAVKLANELMFKVQKTGNSFENPIFFQSTIFDIIYYILYLYLHSSF